MKTSPEPNVITDVVEWSNGMEWVAPKQLKPKRIALGRGENIPRDLIYGDLIIDRVGLPVFQPERYNLPFDDSGLGMKQVFYNTVHLLNSPDFLKMNNGCPSMRILEEKIAELIQQFFCPSLKFYATEDIWFVIRDLIVCFQTKKGLYLNARMDFEG